MTSRSDEFSTKRSGTAGKKTSTRKLQKTSKGSSIGGLRTSGSPESVLLVRGFNTPNFSKKSLIGSRGRGSGILSGEIGKKGRVSSESVTDDPSSLDRSGFQKSKTPTFSQYVKNVSHSRASTETSLLKSDAMTNFRFEKCESDAPSIQCVAERLKLGCEEKSGNKVPSRSDLFLSESLFNIIDLDSREDDYMRDENQILRYVPFQKNENPAKGSNQLDVDAERGESLRNFWSKNSSLNKFQIKSFFVHEEKNETISETYEPDSEKKESGKKEKKEMVVRYLDPPVPVEDDLEIKQSLRNLFFFCLQLICFTIIAMSMTYSEMFYLNALTTRGFFDTPFFLGLNDSFVEDKPSIYFERKTLRTSFTFGDFWIFAETILLPSLYWDFLTSKDFLPNFPKDIKKMFNENQILGVARIRQVRVANNTCKIHRSVKRLVDTCYGTYSVFSEDTSPIKLGMANYPTATAWNYSDAEKLNSSYYWGQLALYGGGGYYFDLPADKEDAKKIIQELKENHWLASATRAIFITFNLYNANINVFCICRIILEYTPVGGVIPVHDFQSLKLIRYISTYDFFVLALEFVYFIFVIHDTINEIKRIYTERSSYMMSWWNILNFSKLILSYLYIILNIFREISATKLISVLDINRTKYTELHLAKELQITLNTVIAVLLFFIWIKLFILLNFTKTMRNFQKTLVRSLKNMSQFLPLFLCMFTAFTFLAYLIFGSQVKEYRTFWHSFLTLAQGFLGEFSFGPLLEANRIMGPIFYLSFIFFIFFVLLNVFIAIVNEAYLAVKSEVIPHPSRILEYIKRGWVNIFSCGRPKKMKISRKLTRKRILFEDIKKALKRAGFSEEEIYIFFHKYNINSRNFLNEATRTNIMEDLELKGVNFTEHSDQFQIDSLRRKLDELKEKMQNWEIKLLPVIDKVDILINRL